MKKVSLILIVVILALLLPVSATACQSSEQDAANQVLQTTIDNLQKEMNSLGNDLTLAAQQLSGIDFSSTEARGILNNLAYNRPYAVDVSIIDRSGRLAVIEPAAYHAYEGEDVSQQEQVIRLFQFEKPVLSKNFQAVEGFEAADFEYPIFSSSKALLGAVSFLFKPETLFANIFSLTIKDTPYAIMALQTDGRVLYDADPTEIGKNTFIDPLYQQYPQLLNLAKEVTSKTLGIGHYEFLNTGLSKNVQKEAIWDTFALYGTEWRIVLIRTLS